MFAYLLVSQELREICTEIVARNLNADEWAAIESDDMFQTESFEGGYDADEEAFCFSYYDKDKMEYWFQLALKEVFAIISGNMDKVQICPPSL